MPEPPELDAIRSVLSRRIPGRTIRKVTIDPKGGALVVRNHTGLGLHPYLAGRRFNSVKRKGKMLIFSLQVETNLLVINPKASGRLQLCEPGASKPGLVRVTFHLQEPTQELRFVDRKRMG